MGERVEDEGEEEGLPSPAPLRSITRKRQNRRDGSVLTAAIAPTRGCVCMRSLEGAHFDSKVSAVALFIAICSKQAPCQHYHLDKSTVKLRFQEAEVFAPGERGRETVLLFFFLSDTERARRRSDGGQNNQS